MPEVGQMLTVCLPSEITRAKVEKIIDQDTIEAKISITPMAKTHTYRLGQVVKFHRAQGVMGQRWESPDV